MKPIALGIDYGEARIGLSASDPLGFLAHPVATVAAKQQNSLQEIVQHARARKAEILVIGLPLLADRSEGEAAQKIRAFAKQLHQQLPDLMLEFQDESYTTKVAASKLRAAGRKAKNSRQIIDQAAAVEILQAWLDRQEGAGALEELRSPSEGNRG